MEAIAISKNRLRSAWDDLFPFPSATVSTADAMASVVLNQAEGNARKSQVERRRFFEMARASIAEVAACVDLMLAFGLIDRETAGVYKSKLTRVSKMLWGLMR